MKQQQTNISQKSIITEDREPQTDPNTKAAKERFKSQTIYLNGNNIFSYLFFTWVSPLLKYGNKFIIEQDDIPLLTRYLDARIQYNNLTKNFYETTKSSIEGWTLIKSILKTFKWLYMKILLLAFLLVCLMMYAPVLTDQIMQYVEDEDNRSISIGIGLFLIVFLTAFIKCIAETHVFYHFGLVGFNLSNTLSMLIFSKALRYPILANKLYTSSNITNFSTTDAQKLTTISYQMTALLFMPLQFTIALFLMYYFIGISFLSGIGIMILAIIVNFFLQRIALRLNQRLLKAKDGRMKVTEQILNIIRFIKINAIEKFFFKKLDIERQKELKYIKNYNMFVVLMIFSYWLWPYAILSITFATFIWLGNDITSHQAFTIIIIFKILQSPLKLLPTAISSAIQIWVSMKRVQKFLLTDQIKNDHIKCNEIEDKSKSYAIKIQHGDFLWGLQPQKQDDGHQKQQKQMNKVSSGSQSDSSLQQSLISKKNGNKPYIKAVSNISLQIPRQKFTMILGNIGSGKSSLLYSMLNQTQCINDSKVQINGSIAFVGQKAWIMSASLKENIVMNEKFDEAKFQEVIHYTALKEDIQIMKDGINTKIGQKGINLSGGQKARVALARALYSNRSIYLLDDIISAVDVHVGKFLMEETIGKYLKNKTVVLSTHAISFAEYADQLIIMNKGYIIKSGTYHQISQSKQFQHLSIKIHLQDSERKKKKQEQKKSKKTPLVVQVITKQQQKQAINKQTSNKMEKVVEELMLPQDRKKGEVQLEVYKHYIEMNGGIIFCIAIVISMSAWLTLILMSNIEIQHWCDNPSESSYHLIFYVIFACSSSIFMAIKATILVFSSFRVGKAAHKKMIKALLYTSISKFYNRVPIGRIINRLTKDLKQIDQNIGFVIGNCLNQIFELLGNLIICVYASSYYILFPIIIVGYLCFRFKGYYMNTQRQCIRLQSITTSPIVGGFISTINGLPTVRAFNLQQYFISLQLKNINKNKRLRLTRQALESWFSLRLTLLSFFINMSAIGFCILGPNTNPALAGLLLTYALTLNEDMINLVFGTSSVQTRLVPFQRVMNFMHIQPEDGYKEYCKNWTPREQGYNKQAIPYGSIQFKNYSAKYRQGSPLVLNDICVKIQKGQKVGIIGRTGAGKSTLAQCLLRVLDASNGLISIDDKNIVNYNLKDLRSNITMIEQEPTLINTTIKQNLDPSEIYSDAEIMKIAKQCNLAEFIEQRGGLQANIGNDSLSVGERQLLCICRAFLKSSKIVLIDEATANIDMRNDRLIQEVIRKNFQHSTVLTIAHRLSTLQKSDKIMVLGGGKLLQWGAPEQLLRLPNGIYRQFCQKNAEEYLK